jgi:hypothetical protein
MNHPHSRAWDQHKRCPPITFCARFRHLFPPGGRSHPKDGHGIKQAQRKQAGSGIGHQFPSTMIPLRI